MNARELGKAIRRLRRGRRVADVAARCRLHPSAWSRYENGKVPRVAMETLARIADALDVTLEELLGQGRVGVDVIAETRPAYGEVILPISLPRATIQRLEALAAGSRGGKTSAAAVARAILLDAEKKRRALRSPRK